MRVNNLYGTDALSLASLGHGDGRSHGAPVHRKRDRHIKATCTRRRKATFHKLKKKGEERPSSIRSNFGLYNKGPVYSDSRLSEFLHTRLNRR
ncbi:hypothetical protein EVAR_65782_1 [Eumeta japonica]|uniref:Uncharacterized protein n=1 Tax=Eumeta variegata TaxID=151549 RepID=A0A4C2A6G5_EUMVA|nr:hypothetical protein EVAR_65782_1 [Eumeta japonica]